MITTSTYRDRVGPRRDVLAACSALDHGTTAELSDDDVDAALRRLLARLAVLMYLHGPGVPARFLEALRAAEADGADAVGVVEAFLESGQPGSEGTTGLSELRQELTHFSRIVDVGALGLQDRRAVRDARRLRNSRRLPEPLKVLSELLIVVRSRMLHRGVALPVPQLHGRQCAEREVDALTSVWAPAGAAYALVVVSPRRRSRKEVGYLFGALLDYLTPVEAVLAVWAHAVGEKVRADVDVVLASLNGDGTARVARWAHPGGNADVSTVDPVEWCAAHLPVVSALAEDEEAEWSARRGVRVCVGANSAGRAVEVTTAGRPKHAVELAPVATGSSASAAEMSNRARSLLTRYSGPEIVSIECGHIHLDRDLDVDQEVGATLGAVARDVLSSRQARPPVLVPMMDDDHVLVRLPPAEYRAFLRQRLGVESTRLVVESSPIVRAIVCALWAQLDQRGLAGRLRERGRNVFLELGSGRFCEVFEDFPGQAVTGCVFFECALLVYRTAPARFDAHFRERFGLPVDVHETACAILDGPGGHDEKSGRLSEFYARFASVTDPREPDEAVRALVDETIADAGRGVAHVNVLEDYYEVQQGKVRAVVKLLGLPMRLVTLHFNARTSRVVLDG